MDQVKRDRAGNDCQEPPVGDPAMKGLGLIIDSLAPLLTIIGAILIALAADLGLDGDALLGDDLIDMQQMLAGIRLMRWVR